MSHIAPSTCVMSPADFFSTEHDRQLLRLVDKRGVLDDVGSLERDPEKEPQRSHGVIENRYIRALRHKMQLKAPHVLEARLVW